MIFKKIYGRGPAFYYHYVTMSNPIPLRETKALFSFDQGHLYKKRDRYLINEFVLPGLSYSHFHSHKIAPFSGSSSVALR